MTVVPALDDVHGKTGNLQALAAGHGVGSPKTSILPSITRL